MKPREMDGYRKGEEEKIELKEKERRENREEEEIVEKYQVEEAIGKKRQEGKKEKY